MSKNHDEAGKALMMSNVLFLITVVLTAIAVIIMSTCRLEVTTRFTGYFEEDGVLRLTLVDEVVDVLHAGQRITLSGEEEGTELVIFAVNENDALARFIGSQTVAPGTQVEGIVHLAGGGTIWDSFVDRYFTSHGVLGRGRS